MQINYTDRIRKIRNHKSQINNYLRSMNPNYRKPLILFVASFALIALGMASKLLHWLPTEVSGTIFGAGMLVQLFSILWLIFVILKPQKK